MSDQSIDFKTITCQEKWAAEEVIQKVIDCVIWDDRLHAYVDGGNFILQINADDMEALKRALPKIRGYK
jgi:hypothetical protein